MTGKELIAGIGYVEDGLIQEAEEKQLKKRLIKKQLTVWKSCMAAACLITLAGGAAVWTRFYAGSKEEVLYGTVTMDDGLTGAVLSGADSYVKVCEGEAGKGSQYQRVLWNPEEIEAYYGIDPEQFYIPEGLIYQDYGPAEVLLDQDGHVVQDTVTFAYAQEGGGKKLTVTVSRLGIAQDLPYTWDQTAEESAEYYDLYETQFEKDGVQYQIIAEELEPDEVIRTVTSILSKEADETE